MPPAAFCARASIVSYVSKNLQPDERLLRMGRLHWIVYLRPLVLAAVCIVCLLQYASDRHSKDFAAGLLIAGVLFGVLAAITFVRAWFRNWTTELAVTNRRIVYKRGFIRRQSIEMNMEKVETVAVRQSLLGRLLNYGTVDVKGTGQSIEHLHRISRPVAVRNAVMAR